MVALSHLAIALAAMAPALAVPTAEAPVQKRGPHNFVMGPDHPLTLARRNLTISRRATNYNQDYTTGGTVYFAPASDEFYVAWDTTDDFVVGVGWNPGSTLYGTNLPSLSCFSSSLALTYATDLALPGPLPTPAASLSTPDSLPCPCTAGRPIRW